MGHVLWDVHATGTWKPPLAPETDDNCERDEDEEEEEVSDFHFTSCLCVCYMGGHAHKRGGDAPTETVAATPNCVGILP